MTNRNFSPFPVLTTKRLILRQLLESDMEEIFLLRSNTTINKYLDRQPASLPAEALNFITTINENIEKNDRLFYWAITKNDNQKLIGTICLLNFSETQNSCELGYELLTGYQGQGIMNEATTCVIEFVFQMLKLTTIDAFTHEDNQSSIKLLQKLNFQKTAICDETNPNLIVFRLVVLSRP